MSKNMALVLVALPALIAGTAFNHYVMDGSSILGGVVTAFIMIAGYRTLIN